MYSYLKACTKLSSPQKKKLASTQEKPSSRFMTRSYPNQLAQLQRLSRIFQFQFKQVSIKRMSKTLIRLPECAGWSVPLLLANPIGFLAPKLKCDISKKYMYRKVSNYMYCHRLIAFVIAI